MAITLRGNQLRTLLMRLKELPRSNWIAGELQSMIDNKFNHYDFIVDTWPDFKALLLRPDLSNPRIKYLHNSVQVYAQEPENIKCLLRNKALVNWSKSVEFAAIDTRFVPAVCDVAREHGKSLMRYGCAYVFRVGQNKAKLHPFPEDLTLSSLHPDQCELINSLWSNKGEGSADYLRLLIETLPSCCLYNRDGDILGCVLSHHHGCIGMLHIIEVHRRKGYAKVLWSQLVKTWFQTCDYVYGFVNTSNEASIQLHKSLGMEIVEDFKFIWRLKTQ